MVLLRVATLAALLVGSYGFNPLSSGWARPRTQHGALSCRAAAEGPGTFGVNVNLYVKEERREEFLKVILNNQKGTLTNEPLAVIYDFGESATERNTFHFQEQYLGEEGFAAHTKAPHFAKWEEFVATDPFTRPPEVMTFELRQTK